MFYIIMQSSVKRKLKKMFMSLKQLYSQIPIVELSFWISEKNIFRGKSAFVYIIYSILIPVLPHYLYYTANCCCLSSSMCLENQFKKRLPKITKSTQYIWCNVRVMICYICLWYQMDSFSCNIYISASQKDISIQKWKQIISTL